MFVFEFNISWVYDLCLTVNVIKVFFFFFLKKKKFKRLFSFYCPCLEDILYLLFCLCDIGCLFFLLSQNILSIST